jgi:hypothetical protein
MQTIKMVITTSVEPFANWLLATAGSLSIVLVVTLFAPNEAMCENRGPSEMLSKALNGVDWKRTAQGIASDDEFQTSVRAVFSALTPDGQQKVSESIRSLKEGKGPLISGTPVDGLLGKMLAKALSPFLTDPSSKDALAVFEDNGNLPGLIESITGTKPPTVATTISSPASPELAGRATPAAKFERQMRFSIFVDNEVVIRVSQRKLYVINKSVSTPSAIKVNGKKWLPSWSSKQEGPTSEAYNLEGQVAPFDGSTVKVRKSHGRGDVAVLELPTTTNNQTLNIKVSDPSAGEDQYDLSISW